MLVCPKCHTQYADSVEFCERDGVKLEAESTGKSKTGDSGKGDLPPKDESAPDTGDLDKLKAQVRELEAKLNAAEAKLGAADIPLKKPGATSLEKTPIPEDKRAHVEPETTEVVEAAEVMHGWLVGIEGSVKGKRFGIPARGIKIGRGKRVQILIEDENVSNTHAWVGVEKNRVVVRDQGSTNGTFINDPDSKPIKEARLSEGDEIIIAGKREIAVFMFSK